MSFRDAKPTVEVEDLHREFKGKEGTVLALDGVDLKVREGEVFGVLGPNGARQDYHDQNSLNPTPAFFWVCSGDGLGCC